MMANYGPKVANDPLAFIMAAEEAPQLMTAEEYAEGVFGLIRSGIIYSLQGSWQRAAQAMVDNGVITSEGVNHEALEELLA